MDTPRDPQLVPLLGEKPARTTTAMRRAPTMRSRWSTALSTLALLALLACGLVFYHASPGAASQSTAYATSPSQPASGSSAPRPGGISHLILLRFKDTVPAAEVTNASKSMLELRDKCLHPMTREPYIRSIRGGKNFSPEGLDSGVTHVFVVEFDSVAHRDYYIQHDPVQVHFQKSIENIVDATQIVVEFTDGKLF